MEYLIKDLIRKLTVKKISEFSRIQKHKENKELMLVSSGRILEIENLIKDLQDMIIYHQRIK
jgi:hypothetical protein